MKGKGEKIGNPEIGKELELGLEDAEIDEAMEVMIRNRIIKANTKFIAQSYKYDTNSITISVGKVTQKTMLLMIMAFVIGGILGLILRLTTTETVYMEVNEHVLMTVKTIFLNLLKMIVGPVVFFSIASSVGSFSNPGEMGKIGVKIMTFYFFTTIFAIFIGFGFFKVLQPGNFGELSAMASGQITEATGEVNFLETIVGMIPSNMVQSFLNSDTMQIILLAILFGIATTLLGQYSQKVNDFLQCANELFLKIAGIITSALPIMICASVASLVITTNLDTMRTITSLLICIFLTYIGMLLIYNMLVLILTKRSPILFSKYAFEAWVNTFALSSSNASMAYTMDVCDKKLGISPKVYSVSIPLGATINMDALCSTLTITTLFFAKVFGIALSPAEIGTLIFTIVVLSMGAPGVPGMSVLCLSVLMNQFGIPVEALAIYVGICSFIDPFNSANNVFGDITGTYIIASRNGLLKKNNK